MMRVAEKAKSEGNIRIVEDATCTFCGCLCDDMVLTVDVDAKKITKAKNACVLGKALFLNYEEEDRPFALIGGKEATTAEAVEEAAQILANARFPIIYGMSDTTCETQRKAVGLMDMLGGTIDSTTSVCHGPTGMALQGGGRKHRDPGRDQEPSRFSHLLGRKSCGISAPSFRPLCRHRQGYVYTKP